MRALSAGLALSVAAALGAGCFDRPQSECAFLCSDEGDCPEGYRCAPDGWCKRVDVAEDSRCPNAPIDAGTGDAPVADASAGGDGPAADAAVDAGPPDAGCGGVCLASETCQEPDTCLCNGEECSTTPTSGPAGTFACGSDCTYQCNSGSMDTCGVTNVTLVSCNGGGDCAITCAADTGDCNEDESDGCEADLTADTTCGSLCMNCESGGQVCSGGSCVDP